MDIPKNFDSYSLFFSERTEKLHSMLVNCGHERVTSPAYLWDGMKRGLNEIAIWQYTVSGCGMLDFDGNSYEVPPGYAVLLTVPEKHCYYYSSKFSHWEFIYVSLSGSDTLRLFSDFRRQNGFLVKFAPDGKTLAKACEILTKASLNQITTRYQASLQGYDFIMSLFEEKLCASSELSHYDFMSKIHDYCLKNIDKNFTVDNLAKISGYSRWHFSRIFKNTQHISPQQFITELKMRMAVRLLQTSNNSIKEIAAKCGFDNISYFCKVFKSIYGRTPEKFRNNQ